MKSVTVRAAGDGCEPEAGHLAVITFAIGLDQFFMTSAALPYDVQFKRFFVRFTYGVDRMALRAYGRFFITFKKQDTVNALIICCYYTRMTRAACGGDIIAMHHRPGIGLGPDEVAAMTVRTRCGHQETASQNTLAMDAQEILLVGVGYGYIMFLRQFFIGMAFSACGRKAEWIDH